MSLVVENPIVNSPFEDPSRYWDYQEGQPVLVDGRRPSGYYLKARTRGPQLAMLEEEFIPIEQVNTLRERVKAWRGKNYPDITPITRQLLRHWKNPERERKLFFCQIEAAETLIWLVEASPADKQGIVIQKDEALARYALKMATGSGKTVVMGMVIAWQTLNKLANPQDRRFSDAVLMICPNLTIRERLQVLLPWHPRSYYEAFDLVQRDQLERLQQGKFKITNWHLWLLSGRKPSTHSRRLTPQYPLLLSWSATIRTYPNWSMSTSHEGTSCLSCKTGTEQRSPFALIQSF